MKTIEYKESPLCLYFAQCVLPLDSELESCLIKGNIGACKYCGKRYLKVGKIQYCSQVCRDGAGRKHGRERTRRHRKNKGKV